jgi:hypothetical protein
MGDGKLQIDQRVDRIESAIRVLAEAQPDQDVVDRIEETLKGGTPVVAQES